MVDKMATMARTTISSISVIPRMRFESPGARCCAVARRGDKPVALSALVGILFAPYGLEAAVEIVADAQNLGARQAGHGLLVERGRTAVSARLRRWEQESHSRCDSSLHQPGPSIGDREIVQIVQIGNRATVENAHRIDAVASGSRRARVRCNAGSRG